MEALCQNFWSQNTSEYFLQETTSLLGDFPFIIFLGQTDPHYSRTSADFVFSSQSQFEDGMDLWTVSIIFDLECCA
jgi:hypothetical protein